MRKCKGFYYENGKFIDFEVGYFHQFGCDHEEFENGAGNFPVAIVELPDGKVVTPMAINIQFFGGCRGMSGKDYYHGWNDEGNLDPINECPFCGGNGELEDDGHEHPEIDENGAYVDMDIFDGDTFWVVCEKCGAMSEASDTPEGAIKNWNRRVKP